MPSSLTSLLAANLGDWPGVKRIVDHRHFQGGGGARDQELLASGAAGREWLAGYAGQTFVSISTDEGASA
jgi:hypothetical protein